MCNSLLLSIYLQGKQRLLVGLIGQQLRGGHLTSHMAREDGIGHVLQHGRAVTCSKDAAHRSLLERRRHFDLAVGALLQAQLVHKASASGLCRRLVRKERLGCL